MNYVDVHSHILPYMDDGSRDMEETLKMLRIAQSEGITDIIVTPHYKAGRFKGDSRQTAELIEEVYRMMDEEGIGINLYPGHEIFYRSELEDKLDSGELNTMNGSEYVLVEFSPMESFLYIRNAMEELFGIGYHPIIAHVERYECMPKHPEYVRELKKMGCQIQVNAASVTGEVGFGCKRFVHKLLKEGLVDYIGTDAHNADRRKSALKKCAQILYKKYDKDYADALLFGNAEEYLLGVE